MFLKDILSLFGRKKEIERSVIMWPNNFEKLNNLDHLYNILGITDDMGPRQVAAILYNSIFDVEQQKKSGKFYTDLEKVLDVLGIQAYFVDMDEVFPYNIEAHKRISACIVSNTEERVIYVNKFEHPLRQRFSVAHEIGHYVLRHLQDSETDILYRNPNSSSGTDSREISANRFASSLLIPKPLVIEMEQLGFSLDMMADAFGVSRQVVEYRLKQLGLS